MIHLFPSRTVALDLFGFSVHWYGIMYMLSFLLALFLIPRLQKYRDLHLTQDDWSRIVGWAVVGVLVGGRLGFVLFYEPAYYLAHPLEIVAVWKGGMASHGGFIGATVAMLWALRGKNVDAMIRVADIVAVPVVLGLGIGRIGNFINQELYGTITMLPWGIAIPGVEGLRHPVQLYEFALCVIIGLVCYWHLRKTRAAGTTFALFLLLYAVERILIEFLRIHAYPSVAFGLVREQMLTIPFLVIGIGIWAWTRRSIKMTKHGMV